MNKYYLSIVLADQPNAVDITPRIDHKCAGPVEFTVGKKVSIFRLLLTFFNLKYLLEDCYSKLDEVKEAEYES